MGMLLPQLVNDARVSAISEALASEQADSRTKLPFTKKEKGAFNLFVYTAHGPTRRLWESNPVFFPPADESRLVAIGPSSKSLRNDAMAPMSAAWRQPQQYIMEDAQPFKSSVDILVRLSSLLV